VLTFATSWMAYQSVFWNLAVGAPDQIATVLTGARGSATQIFADRIDMIFAAIAQASDAAGQQQAAQAAQGAAQAAASGSFTPGNLMWLSALLLLLGTVGVLVTARIALAVLLAVGPVFLIFALFPATRGLTAGWLRGVVLAAVTPLFVVLGGGIMIELLVPVIQVLGGPDGINGRAALALFMIASVHVALMVMVMKVAGTMVSGWRVFGLAGGREERGQPAAAQPPPLVAAPAFQDGRGFASRRAGMVAATAQAGEAVPGGPQPGTVRERRTVIAPAAGAAPTLPPIQQRRARGIGSRFAAPAARNREAVR
jgi:type IV secretion system protein VirB6